MSLAKIAYLGSAYHITASHTYFHAVCACTDPVSAASPFAPTRVQDDKDKNIDNRVYPASDFGHNEYGFALKNVAYLASDLKQDVLGVCVGWEGTSSSEAGNIGERP